MLRFLKTGAVAGLAVAAGVAMVASAANAQDKKPIKVGFAQSLTGFLSPNGKQALLGAEIWRDQINKSGGLIDGRPVELVYYDDKSSPAEVPGIYTKLLDVDKVDLVVSGYATNQIAPAMPVVIRKGKTFISLFGLDVNNKFKYPKYFSIIPTGQDTKGSFTEGFFAVAAAQKPKPQTVALAYADAEFSQNACEGARANAKKYGFKIVYDKAYPPPPKTTDFAPIVQALKAVNADLVAVCAYPLDSVGIVQAASESGLKPKLFGGALVGLQATVFKDKLKGKLNGIVNYETWVPDKKQMYEGTDAFFKEYQSRAKAAGVDALGYYLGGWGYAQFQVLGDAVKAAKSLDDNKVADALRKGTFKTVMGPIKFGKKGEWAESRMMAVQYHDINDKADLETWRGMSYQNVIYPPSLKTGDVVYPYEKAVK
ncbi:MAG: amino acid ABC transporter substrate-binding protein [Xanthobacteraceae bacterium]|jgi:branched-chain amino acid transport system substrate-binding protein|uniref:amino acid ABC transporter substrate-binding protein n=1 Tax=Pseudolabrys sp. TaxID=1960880 RepID=UPI003D0CD49E